MKSYTNGPETTRLKHRAFTVDDASEFFALNGNPEVMQLTGEPVLTSLDAASEAIANYPDFDEVGYGRWACILKQTQTIIGFCGLKYLPELDAVDVGYRFHPEYWGHGFATEACGASLEFGFETLGLEEIFGFVLPENVASIRVLEKVGMQPAGEVMDDGLLALRFVKRAQGICEPVRVGQAPACLPFFCGAESSRSEEGRRVPALQAALFRRADAGNGGIVPYQIAPVVLCHGRGGLFGGESKVFLESAGDSC